MICNLNRELFNIYIYRTRKFTKDSHFKEREKTVMMCPGNAEHQTGILLGTTGAPLSEKEWKLFCYYSFLGARGRNLAPAFLVRN